jgi:cytidine deaminase
MSENETQRPPAGGPELGEADRELLAAALGAREHAYCPYSKFAVGAAVRAAGGAIYVGVNVENASFGLTVCAERNAISAAVAAGLRPGELKALALAGGTDAPITPCGACRQVFSEFAALDAVVLSVVPATGRLSVWRAADLLPQVFKL